MSPLVDRSCVDLSTGGDLPGPPGVSAPRHAGVDRLGGDPEVSLCRQIMCGSVYSQLLECLGAFEMVGRRVGGLSWWSVSVGSMDVVGEWVCCVGEGV